MHVGAHMTKVNALHGVMFGGRGALNLGVMPFPDRIAFSLVEPGGVGASRTHLAREEFDRLVDHLNALRRQLDGEPTITCPVCRMRSSHPIDREDGYCGQCHERTSIGSVAAESGPRET